MLSSFVYISTNGSISITITGYPNNCDSGTYIGISCSLSRQEWESLIKEVNFKLSQQVSSLPQPEEPDETIRTGPGDQPTNLDAQVKAGSVENSPETKGLDCQTASFLDLERPRSV